MPHLPKNAIIISICFRWFPYDFPIVFLWGFIGPIGPWAPVCVRRTGKSDSLDVAALACSSFSTCSPRGTCAPLGPHAPLELHAKTATSKTFPIGQLKSMHFWNHYRKVPGCSDLCMRLVWRMQSTGHIRTAGRACTSGAASKGCHIHRISRHRLGT